MEKSKDYVKVLAQAALCAALCYVGATFIKIDIPVGTEKTMIPLVILSVCLQLFLLAVHGEGLLEQSDDNQ